MESIDLHTLASSLPTAHQNSEAELTNNFKAAALSITTLYRSSKEASKRSYSAGYAAACQDLMQMIQQGVSSDGTGMTVDRVMDFIDARLAAVKSRAEEELEDAETTRQKQANQPKQRAPSPPEQQLPTPSTSTASPPDETSWSRPQRQSPQPSSPSPPPTRSLRGHKYRQQQNMPPDYPFTFGADENQPAHVTPFPSGVGAKRRHAMITMLDPPMSSSSSPLIHASGARRRTRSAAMDVEEDDRPRKRR